MSYVEILVLRHLMRGSAHGYELRKHVEANTGVVLNNNALYPALRRFEDAGAVTKTSQQLPGRPPRHVYTITAVGRELLGDMLAELPPGDAGDDAEFLTRLSQFAMLDPSDRVAVLDARHAAVQQRAELLAGLAERGAGETWGARVTAELLRRCQAECEWLDQLRAEAISAPVVPEGE
ncbi:PadR family transcriptional regulator [Nocardia sp. NPDC005998]|uniref:PadR family transcriptional regulator n=1 Tax=Nocardia sp. NPDC005998 TaxID=3156894 RepID=UPI0033A7C5F5